MTYRMFMLPVFLMGATVAAARGDEPQPMPQPPSDPNIQIQAHGPLHEAFAQPWQKDAVPAEAVQKKPPEPIAEEPPDQRPTGDNVQWIPGYWQYDPTAKDFMWISGVWRNAPEHRRWTPGYWTDTQEGYRWVSGHWAADTEPDRQLVPTPPASVDNGPSAPTPDDHSFYIPGTWFYTEQGWRWRAGYWADERPGYTWVPAAYYWSPEGWTFTAGYWDWDPYRRGLVYAPVYFGGGIYLRPGFVWRPYYALSIGGIYDSLFFRVGYGSYYFGNYYGGLYVGLGFRPWAIWGAGWHDPLWHGVAFAHAGGGIGVGVGVGLGFSAGIGVGIGGVGVGVGFTAGLRASAEARLAGREAGPARTFAEQSRLGGNHPLVASASSMNGVKLQNVSAQQRQTFSQNARNFTNHSVEMSHTTSQWKIAGNNFHQNEQQHFNPNVNQGQMMHQGQGNNFGGSRGGNGGHGNNGHH
jgi:hypothetical protein